MSMTNLFATFDKPKNRQEIMFVTRLCGFSFFKLDFCYPSNLAYSD